MAENVSVTQADREAAIAYWNSQDIGSAATYKTIRDGQRDHSHLILAFARHRIEAERAARLASTQEPATGEVIEAPENGETDPEWRAIRRAIDQFVGRVPAISKHRALNNAHIAAVVERLDATGDREAADTIVWQCWWRALDRERERFLLADMEEKVAALRTPASPFPREEVAAIIARAYGGSLCPGLGVPGDYPVADVDYRAADAIAALLQRSGEQ